MNCGVHKGIVMLFRILSVLYVFIFSVSASAMEDRAAPETPHVRPNILAENIECFKVIRRAIPSFYRGSPAAQTFNKRERLVYGIATLNDMMCADPEWMANIVITVTDPATNESWYGIFHVHVNLSGVITSGASFHDPTWMTFKHESEWQARWCEDIRTVYPKDWVAECLIQQK